MASVHFTEEQSIPSSWRLMIFGGVTLMIAFVAIMVFTTEWNTMPAKEKPAMLSLLLGPLASIFVFFVRLDIRMTSRTFEYKVYPFRKQYKVIPLEKISSIDLTKPKGWKSYSSMGVNRNLNRTELNFGGKHQVTIHMTSGRLLALTTNKPQELKSFLQSLPEGSPKVKIEI